MSDVISVAVLLLFFAASLAFVAGCGRLMEG